jgi:hypothetical protein
VRVGPCGPILEHDAGAVAVVGHPVRLELDGHRHDGLGREQPIEVRGVEPVGDVGDADRPATLDPREETDHPDGRERIAGLSEGRGWIAGSGRPVGAGRSGPRPMVPVAVSGTGTYLRVNH